MNANASASASSTAYLLLFRNAGHESHAHLSPEERQAMMELWNAWYDGLSREGKVLHGAPLALEGRVVAGPRGERVTDGPFAEAKEAVGGYLYLKVASLDEATEIAKGCPGLPIGLTVEVRQVLDHSPVLQGVRGHALG